MSPEAGLVIPYWFLWSSHHEAGEESGRKARPCVVVIAVKRSAELTVVVVAPLTHTSPGKTRHAVEIPARVKRHLSLDAARSWVICDEVNEFEWPGFDMDRTPDGHRAFGRLPHNLTQRIREEVVAAVRDGKLKKTSRD
ncbi:MAG: hypothetical protein A4S17_04725 [Proteobacteria bacterium HN_bin10]|nr:MAG: hypothetical protein A4S17_04725 [Proteobacteria bacterium HN_bin10]